MVGVHVRRTSLAQRLWLLVVATLLVAGGLFAVPRQALAAGSMPDHITFKPVEPPVINEGHYNWYSYDDETGEEWGGYDYPWADGDKLTVFFEDGSRAEYVLQSSVDEDGFLESFFVNTSDSSDVLDSDRFAAYSDQGFDNQWLPGEHTFTILYYHPDGEDDYSFYSYEYDVTVTLKESNIRSISFESVKPRRGIQGVDGYYIDDEEQGEYYAYDFGRFDGDVLKLTYTDGTSASYVFDSDSWCYVNQNDSTDRIESYDVDVKSDQSASNEWGVGSHQFTLTVYGKSCTVDYEVVEDTLVSIAFTPKSVMELEQYISLNVWETDEGWIARYYPYFDEGDQLIFTYRDGSKMTYEAVARTNRWGYEDLVFVNKSDSNDVINSWLIDIDSGETKKYATREQAVNNSPKVGSYNCTLTYQGKTCTMPYKVVKHTASWERLSGKTALDTMKAIVDSPFGFYETGGVVVIATKDNYPDALTAAGLAGMNDAPVLLVTKNSLPSQTKSVLQRLKPTKVYIMGGTAAVSDKVKGDIATACKLSASKVVRVAGNNAILTSVAAYIEADKSTGQKEWSDTCIIATRKGFADALSVAPLSYAINAPIFLTNPAGLSSEVKNAIANGGFWRVIIVGGESAVSKTVENQLAEIDDEFFVVRLGGKNAVETSGLIAQFSMLNANMSATCISVATAANFPDALAGAALCGRTRSVLVLTRPNNYQAIDMALQNGYQKQVGIGFVFGGTAAVPQATYDHCVSRTK